MATAEGRAALGFGLGELRLEREKVNFWMHFSAFVFVNALIGTINLVYSPGTIWFVFVLFPWSIGVTAHFLGAYYLAPIRLREERLKSGLSSGGPPPPPPPA